MSKPSVESFVASEEALHAEARDVAGLDDFGDASYKAGLRVLLESLDRDADLSATGRMIFRAQITDALATRLRVEQRLRDLPAGSAHEIARPIVITGLVRTGSTALHYLMGQDPDLQKLEYWLAAHPQPRPPRSDWDAHPDFQSSAAELELLYENAPELMAVHEMRADWPEECRHILALSFTDDRFEVAATLPTYADWYHNTSHRETYRHHKKLIQLIGSTDPERRWLLKYPVHLRQLPALLAEYPDACIVQTHRDPCAVMASYTSFIAKIRSLHENTVDTRALARELVASWVHAADAGMAAREEHDPDQFFDLYFPDFMSDPIGSVRKIYDHFGQEMRPEGERRLEEWQAAHPHGKHGQHEYEKRDIGVSEDEIRDRFAAYIDRFGL